MRNYVQPGNTLTLPAPRDVASGEGVMVGEIFGVANGDAPTGTPCDLDVLGVFALPKGAGALAVGAPVFWDDATHTVAGTGTKRIGVVTVAAASADVMASVRLNGSF